MQQLAQRAQAPFSSASSRRGAVSVRCSSTPCSSSTSRRNALLGAAGVALASPLTLLFVDRATAAEGTAKYAVKYLPVDSLGTFQKAAQRSEYQQRAENTIKQFLSASDSAACIRLALFDAGTYDIATKAGGANGSIILSPGAVDGELQPLVEKLRAAKKAIDEGDKTGAGPISWADLIYLAGKVTTQASWNEIKINRAQLRSGGETIVSQFGNPWPAKLGRVDSEVRGPNKVPSATASVEEIKAYLLALGSKPASGPFAAKPPFWEKPGFVIWTAAASNPAEEEARFVAANPVYSDIKKDYDVSRRTVTRTNYEMDFIDFYNRLYSLGATFNATAYLYPEPIITK